MSIENLEHRDALKKLRSLVEDIKTCMLTTNMDFLPLNVRPMHTLEIDDTGNIWFFNSKDSMQYTDIQNDNRVQLFYADPQKTEFLSIYGTASLSQDQEKIDALWNPMAKAWFSGKEDPDLSVLRIAPQDAYYWDTKHNKLVTLIKMAASAAGKGRGADGVKGKLKV